MTTLQELDKLAKQEPAKIKSEAKPTKKNSIPKSAEPENKNVEKAHIFNKYNLLAQKIASTDENRAILTGVHFKNNSTIGCDGFRLVEITAMPDDAKDYPKVQDGFAVSNKPFTINTAKIKPDKCKNLPILNESFVILKDDEEKVRIGYNNLETAEVKEIRKIEGDYPVTDSIKPKEDDYKWIYVNAGLLMEMAQICKEMAKNIGTPQVKIGIGSDTQSMIFKTNNDIGQSLYGLLMPMRKTENIKF